MTQALNVYIVSAISALSGVAAARSIIALADSHRRELPDRWLSPNCHRCGSGLSLLLIRCRERGHIERSANLLLLTLVTLVSGLLPLALPNLWITPAYLVFFWALFLLSLTDFDTKLIPNRMLGPATLVGVALLTVGHLFDPSGGDLVESLIGGSAYLIVMLTLSLVSRGGLGFGDVKLSFIIGVFCGYLSLSFVLVACVGAYILGGVVSLLLLATRRYGRKEMIPFGPFMALSSLATIFVGRYIVEWYPM